MGFVRNSASTDAGETSHKNPSRRGKIRVITLILAAVLALTTACGTSGTDVAREALSSTPSGPQASGDTGAATTEPTPTATVAPSPTTAPKPTTAPAPTPAPQALAILAKGFGQGEYRSASYAFIVENPNSGLAVEDSQYQVAVYDANGTVIETDSGYITILFPGEKLGIASSLFLPDGTEIDRLDVQVKPGRFEPFDQRPEFATENVNYVPDDYFPKVTGIVKSPYQKDLENIRVAAIAYDEAGNIIGGGFTYLDFVPANGQAAVDVSITTSGVPAKVELYATLSGLTLLGD
ncbi:hypothetical protein [Sphaerobacter sp.]|uniref:hypothetical protein n=1 Tax=Sphaerobacter sp. TaxID=2099654 RepID=UPI001D969093|nr:hypothetical protein [Sphaerobacter sp.]MBX5444564.1 hypothetical protein [Sphaerobacter sp.]